MSLSCRSAFTIVALKDFSNVPACVVLAGIVGLSLWKVEFVAVEFHKPFLVSDGATGVVGDQDIQVVGGGEGAAVEQLVVMGTES